MTGRLLPGIRHVDHAAYAVPDLEEAVAFFTEVLGAEELYRSRRGPDAAFMTTHFEVPGDAVLPAGNGRMACRTGTGAVAGQGGVELRGATGGQEVHGGSSSRSAVLRAGAGAPCRQVNDAGWPEVTARPREPPVGTTP